MSQSLPECQQELFPFSSTPPGGDPWMKFSHEKAVLWPRPGKWLSGRLGLVPHWGSAWDCLPTSSSYTMAISTMKDSKSPMVLSEAVRKSCCSLWLTFPWSTEAFGKACQEGAKPRYTCYSASREQSECPGMTRSELLSFILHAGNSIVWETSPWWTSVHSLFS